MPGSRAMTIALLVVVTAGFALSYATARATMAMRAPAVALGSYKPPPPPADPGG